MHQQQFWSILGNLDSDNAAKQLAERLEALSPADIIAFQAHFDEAFHRSYDWDLWGAAYLIEGGCSDDGFMDFRYGLISRGEKVFTTALAQPDSLADVVELEEMISDPDVGYVAADVYRQKVGSEIPESDVPLDSAPRGEQWDFEDQALREQKFPRLAALFGD